jgi:hypothetical protein
MKAAANQPEPSPRKKSDKRGKSTNSRQRGWEGKRPSRLNEGAVAMLAAHITERDRRIALDCYEHNVLTTDQIRRLYFTNTRIAQVRLQRLYELRVLERFRPRPEAGEGSRPNHWILDEAGALIVADWKGVDRSELRYTRDTGLRIAASRNLAHHVEANEFFVRLALEAGARHGELREWYGVRTLTHMLSVAVVPDGYGVLAMPDAKPLHVLLELDRGTEPLDVLRSKAKRYVESLPRSALRDLDPVVILATPSERRTRSARTALASIPARLSVITWNDKARRSVLAAVEPTDRKSDRSARLPGGPMLLEEAE